MKTTPNSATAKVIYAIKNVADENLAACASEVIDLRSVQPKMFRDAIRSMSKEDLKLIWIPYFKSLREIPAELFVGLVLDACDYDMSAVESNAVMLLEVLPQRAYNSALHRNGVKSDKNRSYILQVAQTIREGTAMTPGISADRRTITLPAPAFLYTSIGKKLLETQAGTGSSDAYFHDAVVDVMRTQDLQLEFLNTWVDRHPRIRRHMLATVEKSVAELFAFDLANPHPRTPIDSLYCTAIAGYARMNPVGAVKMITEYPVLTEVAMGFQSSSYEMVQVDTGTSGKHYFHTGRMSYSNLPVSGESAPTGYPVAVLILIAAIDSIVGRNKPELVPGYKTLRAAIRKLPPVATGESLEFDAGDKSRIQFARLVASQIAYLGNFGHVLSMLLNDWRGFKEAVSAVEGISAVYDFMFEHRHRLCIPGKARSTAESHIRDTVKLAFRSYLKQFPEFGYTDTLVTSFLNQREEKPTGKVVGELYGMRSPSYGIHSKHMDRVRAFMKSLMTKNNAALSPRVGKVRKPMGWLSDYLRSIDVHLDHCLKHANQEGVRALYALDAGACFLADRRNAEWSRRSMDLKSQLIPLVPKIIYVMYPQFAQDYTAKPIKGTVVRKGTAVKEQAFEI